MGLNITCWNCQGIRSKRKELELYLNENTIDIIALNETKRLISKFKVMILSEMTVQLAQEVVLPSS